MKHIKLLPTLILIVYLALFTISLYVLGQISIGNLELAQNWPWIITLLVSAVSLLFMARDFRSIK